MRKMCVAAILGVLIATPSVANQSDQPITVVASYYQYGKWTASGERFHPNDLSAAHRTLPFGTEVKVTNVSNDKSVVVKINDRGPHIKSRDIDLSRGAARKIGMLSSGVAKVTLEVIDKKDA